MNLGRMVNKRGHTMPTLESTHGTAMDPKTYTLLSRGDHDLLLRAFQPGDEAAFRDLNEQWIAKFFRVEDKDRETLNDPVGKILNYGGQIFLALIGEQRIATCALIALEPGAYEVAKMAVEESYRGAGIGRALLEYTIAQAVRLGAHRLYLETNKRLINAIHLYEAVGFRHLDPKRVKPSPYARANVFMEKFL
jgi:putative acetyltransferase